LGALKAALGSEQPLDMIHVSGNIRGLRLPSTPYLGCHDVKSTTARVVMLNPFGVYWLRTWDEGLLMGESVLDHYSVAVGTERSADSVKLLHDIQKCAVTYCMALDLFPVHLVDVVETAMTFRLDIEVSNFIV
jgi:hypothetical protein